jgi:Zn finger protein HypA/HybF involved in hydrogenase expression
MPEIVGYRCKVCDEGFVFEILTKDEVKDRRKVGLPTSSVKCPKCGSDQVKRTK